MPVRIQAVQGTGRGRFVVGHGASPEPTGGVALPVVEALLRSHPRRATDQLGLPGPDGRRPLNGGTERLQTDPAWKGNLTFNEYFHGDNGAGLGATHQTGWTALVADLILDPPGSK